MVMQAAREAAALEARVGQAAGVVWSALHANGPMSKERICISAGLPADLADQAIGWLAREGKLRLEQTESGRRLFKLQEP